MDLGGSACVVTGASGGIGRAVALELASAGARVCAVARTATRLAEVVDLMGGPELGHSHVVADVSERAAVRRLGEHMRASYGRCDVLVNNAGIPGAGSFEAGGVDGVERVMATNFFGAVNCTAALLPLLLESSPSHVVNVGSVAGRIGLGYSSAYCASKFALTGWSESLWFELRPQGVNISLVEPGPVPTPGFPQHRLLAGRVLRLAVATDVDVARAVMGAIARRRAGRVVPRWYYLLQFPKLAAPSAFRAVQDRILRAVR